MCFDIWKRLSTKRDWIYVIEARTVIRIEDFAAGILEGMLDRVGLTYNW